MKPTKLTNLEEEVRDVAESDLVAYIKLVAPTRALSGCHIDVIRWWERPDAKSHQLLLFPRDHMKSALAAFRLSYRLTKKPELRSLLISSTSALAQKQLFFIKNIFESPVHRKYWPLHLLPPSKDLEEEIEFKKKQPKWNENEIYLGHPIREELQVRDPSVFTGGLTTNLVGMHCDIALLDDVVTGENAYTAEGRARVGSQYALLSSIEGTEAEEWAVGTRYHPNDLYSELKEMEEDVYNPKTGHLEGSRPIYEVLERVVEDSGIGEGTFLWPREKTKDGRWYGFDKQILARKRGQYKNLNRMQFRAQYYNDPSDPDDVPVSTDKFQYYDPDKNLKRVDGKWYCNGNRLNVFAAIDFAYSAGKNSDYTCIVVVGVDADWNIYVLDIDRFKAEAKVSTYYEHILHMLQKWDFRKLRAEVTAAQRVIVRDLKESYLKPNGLSLTIEDYLPSRQEGSKEERIDATLIPKYDNYQIYHTRAPNMFLLEQELQSRNPPHDDIKDALASVMGILVKPTSGLKMNKMKEDNNVLWHPRFGGRAF